MLNWCFFPIFFIKLSNENELFIFCSFILNIFDCFNRGSRTQLNKLLYNSFVYNEEIPKWTTFWGSSHLKRKQRKKRRKKQYTHLYRYSTHVGLETQNIMYIHTYTREHLHTMDTVWACTSRATTEENVSSVMNKKHSSWMNLLLLLCIEAIINDSWVQFKFTCIWAIIDYCNFSNVHLVVLAILVHNS